MRHATRRAVATLTACTAFGSHAALPHVTMSFPEPTGVVGPRDAIDLWVTLTVDADSSPLVFDLSLPAPFGMDPADVPTRGFFDDPVSHRYAETDFASYTAVEPTGNFHCNGSFTDCWAGSPYDFSFNWKGGMGQPSFNGLTKLNLQPGESYTYLFGQFVPHGVANPGTYAFYTTEIGLAFVGTNADGYPTTAYHVLGATCRAASADCAFTRTVVAVPEPASWISLALGLLGIGAAARRNAGRR